jgi:hypothetical protein
MRKTIRELLGENEWREYEKLRNKIKTLRYQVKNHHSVIACRRRRKQRLIEYKGGKCQQCGYDKPIYSAYDFHHRDPKQKDFTISHSNRGFEFLKKEVDKCDLLCKNCHAEVHSIYCSDGVVAAETKYKLIDKIRQYELKLKELRGCIRRKKQDETKHNFSCIACGKPCDNKYCSQDCSHKHRRIVERPSKEELEKLIEQNNWVTIGQQYGVSDNAVRKWARKYGLI